MDEEAFVEIGGGIGLPFFGRGHIHLIGEDLAFVGPDKVEQEPEQGRFAGAVIADESDEFACLEGEGRDIDDCGIAVIGFDELLIVIMVVFLVWVYLSLKPCRMRCLRL